MRLQGSFLSLPFEPRRCPIMQSTASTQAFAARGMLMLICPIVQNASSDSEHVWFILDGKITVDAHDEIEVFLLFISN